jgi:hypothetical protein
VSDTKSKIEELRAKLNETRRLMAAAEGGQKKDIARILKDCFQCKGLCITTNYSDVGKDRVAVSFDIPASTMVRMHSMAFTRLIQRSEKLHDEEPDPVFHLTKAQLEAKIGEAVAKIVKDMK